MRDVPKPFLEHLEDLRMTVIKMAVALVTATVLCFIFRRPVLEILYKPLIWAGESPDKFLKVLGVVDPFMLALQIAFFAGFLFALPLLLYFAGLFVLPALTDDERTMIAPVFFGGTGLFVGGVAFCYYVLLPQALRFFLNFSTEMGFSAEWTVQNYIGFVVQMLAALGICFELPMVILILAKLGLVDAKMLSTHRKHAIVAIVVLAAVITPTQDIFTLAIMSGPMWVLYELCVVICWWMERKDRQREAGEKALAHTSKSTVVTATAAAAAPSVAAEPAYSEGDPYEQLMDHGGYNSDIDGPAGTPAEGGGTEAAPTDGIKEPDAKTTEAQTDDKTEQTSGHKEGDAPEDVPAIGSEEEQKYSIEGEGTPPGQVDEPKHDPSAEASKSDGQSETGKASGGAPEPDEVQMTKPDDDEPEDRAEYPETDTGRPV